MTDDGIAIDDQGFARCPVCRGRMDDDRIALGLCWCCRWKEDGTKQEEADDGPTDDIRA